MTATKFKLERTYREHKIYNNTYCLFVTLARKTRYFYNDGTLKGQVNRCIKEIDDFLAGEIK